MESFSELFSRHLRRWLADTGQRQADLARLLGVDPSLVTHYAKGAATPDPTRPTLAAICGAFDLSAADSQALYRACGVDLDPVLQASA